MTSSADELVKKAVEMRESGRIDEAIIAARRATVVDPEDANTWWQLGQAVAEKDGAAAAITHFKKTVELANGFAYGWHRLPVTVDQFLTSLDLGIDQLGQFPKLRPEAAGPGILANALLSLL